MSEWRARFNFSTVYTRDGEEEVIAARKGDLLNLDDDAAGFLQRDMPGCLVKPRAKTATTGQGKGRQVADAPKRRRG